MQAVLGPVADQAALETKFVQRRSKMNGSKFAKTLVLGWLKEPQSTLEQLRQTAATQEVTITAQGLDQRFTPAAAECLLKVLEAAVERVIAAEPVAIPVLQRFKAVYLDDSSTITLPDELRTVWQGCGGIPEQGSGAGLKLQVRLDYARGTLWGPFLQQGRDPDHRSPLQAMPVEAGSLRIADLGYWNLAVYDQIDKQGAFWFSRIRTRLKVYDDQGREWELGELLRQRACPELDISVTLGLESRLPARLVARQVPPDIAEERRRRLRKEAKDRGRTVSARQLAMADWSIFVTNVPAAMLSLEEALVLAHTRWQIELLFKLWKSQGHVDEWRSQKPWRILCEVYAKLIGLVIQHWILLVSCWQYPDRSLFKAARAVRDFATSLACVVNSHQELCRVLEIIKSCLSVGCRINKRKTEPHTYQLLLALSDEP